LSLLLIEMLDFPILSVAANLLSVDTLVNNTWTPTTAEITHPFWIFQWELIWHHEVLVCGLVLFFSGILCSAAGIGGGGIYVAVLMVTGRLTPHNAVPLSKAIVFFGAISSLVVNLWVTKMGMPGIGGRGRGKTVIDSDACRLVVPATLIGTFLGVMLNRHTSDYIIVVLLTALLGLMTGMVLRTARQQALAESQELQRGIIDALSNTSGASSGEQPTQEGPGENAPLLGQQQAAVTQELISQVPTARKQDLSGRDAGFGSALLFIVILGGIMRFHMHACRAEVLGDQSQIGACRHPVNLIFGHRMEQWMNSTIGSTILQQLAAGVPMWCCVAITMRFGYVANQIGWQPRSVVLYQVVSVTTGVLAGLVGVGGGLILSPFFLLTGMEPAVAVGTSATCVLFTSSSTTMQYVFTDRIIMSLALVYGLVTLVASFTGTCLVHIIQDKFARKSYITFIVALGVAISAVLSVIKFVYLIADPKGQEAQSLAEAF